MRLIIGNSYSQVQGFSLGEEKTLREALRYRVDTGNWGAGHRSQFRYLIDRKGVFPTGLLHVVLPLFTDWVIEDKRVIPRSTPGLFKLNLPMEPYKEQIVAADTAAINERGTVVMPTGSGKSVTMALLIKLLQVKTLIIVPNLTLKTQLTESFKQYFGSLDNITIENIDSAKLKNAKDYGCLIIDEAHHVAASTYRKLNKSAWGGIFYRFFFTATPYRSKNEEQMLMESISGHVVYRLSYKDAVSKGFIVPVEVYYFDLPKVEVNGHTWAQVYKELVTDREDRNKLIQDLLLSLHVQGASTLCLVKEIKHGETLSNGGAFAFANGKDANTESFLREFSSGTRKVLIGTVGVCGEGADTRACEWAVIAGLGKSKNLLMQNIGRAVRRYPGKESAKVVLIRDRSHKWTLTHFREQVKVIREEFGVEPVKLEII